MFSNRDLQQLQKKGIGEDQAKWQINQFEKGIPPTELVRAAAINDGILKINDTSSYVAKFENSKAKVTKFVPASGAASRMFKALFEALEALNAGKSSDELIKESDFISKFYSELSSFAFYEELKSLGETDNLKSVLETILLEGNMNYGGLPKGLLSFHKANGKAVTPVEEHLYEGVQYAKGDDNSVNLHFTVSPEHENNFKELLNKALPVYGERFNVTFNISFSQQSPSTDTLSVDLDNKPFRTENNEILFRPGGHGALIKNLDSIESDIVFVKNIDNVVPEKLAEDTVTYKKVLAGVLLDIQEELFALQVAFDKGESDKLINKAKTFYKQKLFVDLTEVCEGRSASEQYSIIKQMLNRPLRACGVVKNTGEPGGGPFWTKNTKGEISLQVVESSQVDLSDKSQEEIFNSSTHFNPVDLVCGICNAKGEKFNLANYVDNNTCFISKKSKSGKELKALELPGLWNGAMAFWNTVFVEVPISTFNPVKTVNDLLRSMHQ